MKKFSIIIVTYKRPLLLQRCLQSITPYLKNDQFDIQVVINGSDSETSLMLKNSYPMVKKLEIAKTSPGEARNQAAKLSDSEYLFFLDDDTILPFDYFDRINEIFESNPKLEIFGGPDANYPNSGSWEKALSVALTSPLATAGTRFRHTTGKREDTDGEEKFILCNLWIKNSLFKDGLIFDKRFFRNEENVLLFQAKEKGIRLDYFPKLFVYHKRKSNVLTLFKAVCMSGSGRLRSFFLFPTSFNPIFFVPFIFANYVIAFFLFDLEGPIKILMYLYIFLNFYFAWKLSKDKRNTLFILKVSFIQFVINFSYGIGFYYEFLNQIISLAKKLRR